jgi:hypothetical protein
MKTPIVAIDITSIYKKDGLRVPLPAHLAKPTPDTHDAILAIRAEVRARGRDLVLSDLFRTHDMQFQAALDFETGKKAAFSPRPVGSMHEAGRAFDLSLADLKLKDGEFTLKDFWDIAAKFGVVPIIKKPDSALSEAWHFDCPGSHQVVYDYYNSGKAANFVPYKAMAISGVIALGLPVDEFADRQTEAALQFGLIRLGFELGAVDGFIGKKTRAALEQSGIPFTTPDETLLAVEDQLQTKFPLEYQLSFVQVDENRPDHVIV